GQSPPRPLAEFQAWRHYSLMNTDVPAPAARRRRCGRPPQRAGFRRNFSRICLGIVAILWAAASLLAIPASADEHPAAATILDLHLTGEVNPILATYIDEGLTDAANRHASLVVITMDTPGGLSDSMKDIIQHILNAPMPVVVYVAPTSSRGASAGF